MLGHCLCDAGKWKHIYTVLARLIVHSLAIHGDALGALLGSFIEVQCLVVKFAHQLIISCYRFDKDYCSRVERISVTPSLKSQ